MEQAVERVQKIVAAYKPSQPGNELKLSRALLAAINGCLKYIDANEKNDRGCAQRIVRELHEILVVLPTFRGLSADKSAVNKLHTRKLAEGQIALIQDQLRKVVREEEKKKSKEIREWLKTHAVFSGLMELLSKPLPKTAYILLFKETKDGALELVINKSDDGRVFTRLRAPEFKDPMHVQKVYGRQSIVGAAVINEKELLGVFGRVPEPQEGKDQLAALMGVSSEAASKPARDFLDANEVLGAIHKLSRDRKLPKDSYMLLFQRAEDKLAIVVRTSDDGKVVTRYWPNEFAIKYKVFENWRDKPRVEGAAVIHGDQLLHALGELPPVDGEQTQAQAVLAASFAAVDRPHFDYVEEHPVLKPLYELAVSEEYRQRHVDTVLFTIAENGAVTPLRVGAKGQPKVARIPLHQFQNPRALHQRFGTKNVVGASVLSESEKPEPRDRDRRGPRPPRRDEGDKQPQRQQQQQQQTRKPVVLAAFGRTPLKVNVLATPEMFRRLGFEID